MNYIELLEKYMQGLTSLEEEKALIDWMKHDSNARSTIYAYYEKKWNGISDDNVSAELQYKMLMNIKQNINQHKIENKIIGRGKKVVLRDTMKYAAVILMTLFVSVFSAYYYFSLSGSDVKNFVVYADKGQRSSLILPDGTKVWLNSDSKLEYDNTYGVKERKVKLTGEAYFEVAKDKEHRFRVNTDGVDVEALGTSFNVQSYPNEDEIITTLLEGKLKVSISGQEAILLPNQQACFGKDNNKLNIENVENANYSNSWTKGEFAFNGETLEEIAIELSRMYNMEIKFNSEEIKSYNYSGIIKNNSLFNVLEIIELTSPVTYEVVNDSIILDKQR